MTFLSFFSQPPTPASLSGSFRSGSPLRGSAVGPKCLLWGPKWVPHRATVFSTGEGPRAGRWPDGELPSVQPPPQELEAADGQSPGEEDSASPCGHCGEEVSNPRAGISHPQKSRLLFELPLNDKGAGWKSGCYHGVAKCSLTFYEPDVAPLRPPVRERTCAKSRTGCVRGGR